MSKMKEPSYLPPFTLTDEITNLVIEIAELLGSLSMNNDDLPNPRLRKQNRIKTIQSSLAIENNSLSVEKVTAIIEGKHVLGAPNEIKEVKNAIDAYNLLMELNPYKEADLLRAHRLMMSDLVKENGKYRHGGVGVFSGQKCIHMAPPAMRVPSLIKDLLGWVKKTKVHPLISSCVFHYEFEFIHPFSDGNGRMGRLWQSLILGKLNPIFEHLPVENMVFANQQKYYDAITESTNLNDSYPFIDFMLNEILKTLQNNIDNNKTDIYTGGIGDKSSGHSGGSV